MGNEGTNWKAILSACLGTLIAGVLIGFLFAGKALQPGCKIRFSFAPPAFETDCPNPFETQLSFGRDPSSRSLSSTLEIIRDKTRSKGQARIYVADEVFEQSFAKATIRPPEGSQGSITTLRQILDDADVSDQVDICLVASGGFRVQMRAEPRNEVGVVIQETSNQSLQRTEDRR